MPLVDSSDRRLLAKLEWYNPFGSLKDRAAYWMLQEAQKAGRLHKDQTIIIEPTSGNTGIALAGIARLMGHSVEIVIPERVSAETKALLRALGAELVETEDDLCPRVGKGTDQSIALAEAIVKGHPDRYYMPNQYVNDANYLAHYEGTGPEIWEATGGQLTHFVSGIGTGGTITGVAQFLKERNPSVKIVAVEPQKGHRIQGLRNLEESAMPELLKRRAELVDEWVRVSDADAFAAVQEVARVHQLFVGPSSGAVYRAAENLDGAGTCVAVFADDGRKFRSVYEEVGVFTPVEFRALEASARYQPPSSDYVLAALRGKF